MPEIVSCRFEVSGVRTDKDVKKALQTLYDIFADHGLGQATFEITAGQHAQLVVKHVDTVRPDPEIIDRALARAGDFRVVSSRLHSPD
ncbi:hypothetical protein [Dietzia cinnamea]|uniref:Uncharacterized protein n=1 Tax=Dietzia cinnamea TaxID=321318 RepID=A0A177LEE9_9ACTN|nr:hypothetical protein [Dietzia cinnamea]EFV91039.1 hypothetical protein ES5_12857 [Dietzia cinnamea P4]OAH64200.1 hypothetical protein AYJ66_00195 [Dietzia cinnamea]TCW21938.1 hypothetical protein EDD19_12243 [Dietzia cinnamea]